MSIADVHHRIEESHHKPWQIYLLVTSLIVTAGVVEDVGVVLTILNSVERFLADLKWLVVLGMQGIVIAFLAAHIYEQGDGYAKSMNHLFGSKDRILWTRIAMMTVVAAVVNYLVPIAINTIAVYPIIQTAGAVITLGILLVHENSSDWNRSTEWPGLIGGAVLAAAPTLL